MLTSLSVCASHLSSNLSVVMFGCYVLIVFVGRKVQQKYAVWHGHQTTTRWQSAHTIELFCCTMNTENEETNLLQSQLTQRLLQSVSFYLFLPLSCEHYSLNIHSAKKNVPLCHSL